MGKKARRWLRKRMTQVRPGGLVVEVGSWRGRSTQVLAKHLPPNAHLYAVDTWAGTPDDAAQHELYADAGDVFADFWKNLLGQIRAGRLTPLRMDSQAGAAVIRDRHGIGSVDFVFIDADHRYEAVRADIAAYLPLVRPGGVLGGHDFHWPGVERAVLELPAGVELGPKSIWAYPVPEGA